MAFFGRYFGAHWFGGHYFGGSSSGEQQTTPDPIQAAKGFGGVSRKRRRRQVIGDARVFRVLPPLWLVADGEVSEPSEGDFAARIAPRFTLRSAGDHGVAGDGHAVASIDAVVFLAAVAFVAPCGDVRATVSPFCRSAGRHDHFSDAELALLPLFLEI